MANPSTSLLARSPQGEAHYCACRDRVNLRFKERWFRFETQGLAGFRAELGRLLGEERLMRRLIAEAREEASGRGMAGDSLPTLEDFLEMLALIDSAILVLEAQAIVRRV